MRKLTTEFRSVNLLYFVVICLMVANLLLVWLPQYVRLTINEILFVFLPGFIYLRATRQPIISRVRWRWPGWKISLLALLIGAGLYPFSAFSAGALVGILGYSSLPTPADAIPTTAVMGLFAVLSFAILAPLCEEFLFRGILQPVYETLGWKWGVIFVGFLFVAFHLSLLQGLSIILLALALGFVNYRTRSLPASILTHFGANGLAALVVTQQVFPTGIQNWITSIPALVCGLVVAILAVFGLVRLTSSGASIATEINPAPLPSGGQFKLSTAWPVLAALAIFLSMIGAEWVYSRASQAGRDLQLTGYALQAGKSPWSDPQTWRYEIHNVADEVVGEGACRLLPEGNETQVTCTSTVQAYEVKQNQGTYISSGGTRVDVLRWKSANGEFITGSYTLELQDGFGSQIDFELGSDRIEVYYQPKGQPEERLDLQFSQTALSTEPNMIVTPDYTWPWQLAGLYEQAPDTGNKVPGDVLRFHPYTWNNDTRSQGPLSKPHPVVITAAEVLQTPAGHFTATAVRRGDHDTAWYAAVNDTVVVVKYFNGIETWYLKP